MALFLVSPRAGFPDATSSSVRDQLSSIPARPAEKIDLLQAMLLVSRDWDPKADVDLPLIDQLTEQVRKKIDSGTDPRSVVEVLRHAIHDEWGFHFTERVDPQGFPLAPDESFLHGLLQTRRGYCMTLSLLYLIVGDRLDLPLHGVALPNHFFVRFESPGYRVNIETTQDGKLLPDDFYYERFGVTPQTPFFMKNLGKKQTLGAYFSNVGTIYFKAALPKKAVFYLRLAVEINPRSLEARNNLGNVLSEMKLYDQAIEQYEAAWDVEPNDEATALNLAIAYSEAGLNDQAIEAFLRVAQMNPASIVAHQELARLYLDRRRPVGALLHLKKLVRLDPQNLRHRLRMADVYLRLNHYRLALQTLQAAQALSPDNFELKEKLAEAYYRLEDFDRAIEALRYLIEQRPEFLRAYVQLGWTYYRTGNVKMAIVWTKRGLTEGRGDYATLAYMNLGFYHLLEKQYPKARDWYRKALADNKPHALEDMITDLNEAAKQHPDFAELEFFIGWLYVKSGEKEKAAPHLKYYLSKKTSGPRAREARDFLEKMQPGSSDKRREDSNETPPGQRTPKDMAKIPAGFFTMGSDFREQDERPAHDVYLDAFYIDKYEVSAEKYAEFLNQIGRNDGYYRINQYGTLKYDEKFFSEKGAYPINNVSWMGADAYCRWKNKRLPTEAEWEKAARGVDGRSYPWGNTPPGPWDARFNQFWEQMGLDVMVPVDSMPDGKSPFGVYHMAGNVKEWVDDWYDSEYYRSRTHKMNPKSPPGGIFKVIKGGSWNDMAGFIYSSFRNNSRPEIRLEDYGFRCAKNAEVENNTLPKRLTRF